MAMRKVIEIQIGYTGDGITSTLTLDLLADPYAANVNLGGSLQNWFAADRHATLPTDCLSANPNSITASLSGTTLTLSFSSAPAVGTNSNTAVYLFF